MNMEELIKRIDEEIENLKQELSTHNKEELKFFERLTKFSRKSLYEIDNIDPTDIILGYIRFFDEETPFRKLKDDMERICYIDNFNLNDVNKIFENFNIFNEKDALDLLKNECVDNKRIKELDLEKDFDGFIEILNTIFSTSRTAMNILINLYEEYDEKGMFSDLTLFNDLKTIITTNKEFKVLETDKSEQTSLQLSKLLIDDYENSYKVFDYFNLFKVYQKKLVKKTNNHKFNALKKISAYEEAKKVITSSKDALPTDELMLIDPDIAFEIIKYKSNKLEKEYREEKELYEINNNEITPLNEALYKYGIHFFTYEEKKKILDNIIEDYTKQEVSWDEYLSYKKGNSKNEIIEKMSAVRKEMYGRGLLSNEKNNLIQQQYYLSERYVVIGTKELRVETDFYRDSKAFDNTYSKTDKRYWSSNIEMFARAFQCYIKDKLSPDRNDYLCGHADCYRQEVVDRNNDRKLLVAYPEGEERQKLNEQFDKMMEQIKEMGLFQEFSKEAVTFENNRDYENINSYDINEDFVQTSFIDMDYDIDI